MVTLRVLDVGIAFACASMLLSLGQPSWEAYFTTFLAMLAFRFLSSLFIIRFWRYLGNSACPGTTSESSDQNALWVQQRLTMRDVFSFGWVCFMILLSVVARPIPYRFIVFGLMLSLLSTLRECRSAHRKTIGADSIWELGFLFGKILVSERELGRLQVPLPHIPLTSFTLHIHVSGVVIAFPNGYSDYKMLRCVFCCGKKLQECSHDSKPTT